MNRGTLYGVSVGPGDPELLTVKAVKVLKSCGVVAVPETKSGATLALDIAGAAVDLAGKTILKLPFPMTRDEAATRGNHRVQAETLLGYLRQGQDVAMVNLGDVSIFSTFRYLMELVAAAGCPVEMVPGVPSFCAVAATLKTSLTEKDQPLTIVPAGYDGVADCLALPGTKVLMKPRKALSPVLDALEEQELLDRAAMVENCGLPGEKIYPSLSDFDETETGYFTTVIVGSQGKERKDMGELSQLPNIGKVVEQQLHQVGIDTYAELARLGAEQAWLKIQSVDASACIHRLLALEGAIQGVPKAMLPEDRKAELKAFYQAHK